MMLICGVAIFGICIFEKTYNYSFFSAIQIQAEDITFNCQNLNNFEDVNKLIIKYKDKHLYLKKYIFI